MPVRWWRQLTSMRTALLLLFLLAVAAVPGSVFPQRTLNPDQVATYFADHPRLAPVLDRLSVFDVFAAPWFAAIYLLLAVSLIGCLVPRIRLHARAMWRRPPGAPRHLDRLPVSAELCGTAATDGTGSASVPTTAVPPAADPTATDGATSASAARAVDPAATAAVIRSLLRRHRWRAVVRTEPSGAVTVSAEKGYLRETGNLVFHLALLALLAGVAAGALWGWRGGVLITEGGTFCNSVQAYDQFTPGRAVREPSLPPFCVTLDRFHARYLPDGQPVRYAADVRWAEGAAAERGDPTRPYRIRVNEPLRVDGASVYLINTGYAPILRYTDRHGTVFTDAPPFLPSDGMLTSEGAYLLPDANQDPDATEPTRDVQVAFAGYFLPTAPTEGPPIRSVYPAAHRPAVTLLAYRGDTGLNSGIPRSVYSVDQRQVDRGALKPVGAKLLFPGQTWTLDDGTTLTFVGYRQWMSVQVAHKPGEKVVLGAAVAMVVGLIGSLTVRRRRIWFRVAASGPVAITAGGLARTDSDRYLAEFTRTVDTVADLTGTARPLGPDLTGITRPPGPDPTGIARPPGPEPDGPEPDGPGTRPGPEPPDHASATTSPPVDAPRPDPGLPAGSGRPSPVEEKN